MPDPVAIPTRSIVCIADDSAPIPLLRELRKISPNCIAGVWLGLNPSPTLRASWESPEDQSPIVPEWENWLSASEIRLIIFSGQSSAHLEALRQLAAAGKSVIIYPQLAHELSLAYELSLGADQTPIDVFPVRPRCLHSALRDLRDDFRSQTLGQGVHLQLERKIPPRSESGHRLLSVTQLEECWVEDAAVLDFLAGPFGQLTATRAGASGSEAALQQIIVSSQEGPQAVWSCSPGETEEWKLTAAGETGKIELSITSSGEDWNVTRIPPKSGSTPASDTGQWTRFLLEQIHTFFQGTPHPEGLKELIRSYELLDASRRSLKRRRTIDLYYDAPTERGNFKTQMAAIGCGVLMYTLFAMLATLGLGELLRAGFAPEVEGAPLDLSPSMKFLMQVARILTFGPLALFLGLQFLMYFTRSSRER